MTAMNLNLGATIHHDCGGLAEPNEVDIKRLALHSRRAALDLVVRKFGERLFVHALYILKDAPEARDVVQEVFIKALRESRFYDEDFKIQAWLYRVTRNLCFNLIRDRRRRGAILSTGPRMTEHGVDPLEAIFDGERQAEVLAAMARLSEDHEEILRVRYYDDLSYQEISDRLGIKLGTVMSRLSRARDRLLEVLGEDTPLKVA